MKVNTLPVLFAGIVFYSCFAQADSPEEIVVTGTRTPVAVDKLAASTTIITREDIDNLQVNSLPDLLEGIAGIDVTVSGGYGKATDVRMRGTESDHVLVLVDGVRIGSATLGTAAFQHLPVAQIERIEIVRGPRSSVWGSEAIGGVIHIFTRKGSGDTPRFTLDTGGGSYNTYDVTAGVSGEYKEFNYSAALSYFDSQGIDAREPTAGPFGFSQPDKDGYDNLSVNFRGGYSFGELGEIDAFILRATGTTEFDGTFQDKTDFVQQILGGTIRLKPLDKWQTLLRLSEARDETENFTPGGALASVFDTKRLQLSWQNDVSLFDGHDLSAGIDYRQDKIDSTSNFPQTSRDNVGIYGQYSGNLHGHQLIASIRWDDDEVFGSETTGGAGWSYIWRDWLRMYASYGTAYKTPTFNELFFPFFGNPNLGPETADSYEAGLEGQHDRLNWSIRAYRTAIENLIVTVFDPLTFNFAPENVDKAEITGVESEISIQWDGWDAVLVMEYLNPENRNTGNRLARRVKKRLSLDISRNIGQFSFGARLLAEGNRFNDTGNFVQVAGFATVDLRAGYKLSDNISVQIKLANLLDKDYQTIDTFNSLGRNFFLSLHYQSR